jgi:hypothetical protein
MTANTPILFDLARETVSTVGTGSLTLTGAVPGYLSFANAGVVNGATITYGISDGVNCEVGWGVYTASGKTLTRHVFASSAGASDNSPISLSGNAQVAVCALSQNLPQVANVLAFGAAGDGVTDDTAAINRAIATGLPVYLPANTYLVSSDLLFNTSGQPFYGDGREVSIIAASVASGFSQGVINVGALSEPGPDFHDFHVGFVQTPTGSRSGLKQFPPAFYMTGCARFQIYRCRISCAMFGVMMTGNCGGAVIEDLEISAFNAGIVIDGSEDTIRITNMHCWPFGYGHGSDGMTTAQQTIFEEFGIPSTLTSGYTGAIAIAVGRCDGLEITNCLSFAGLGIYGVTTVSGTCFGNISQGNFDTNDGIYWNNGGFLTIAASYFSCGAGAFAIQQFAGVLNISSSYFGVAPDTTLITVDGGSLVVTSSYIYLYSYNISVAIVENSGDLIFSNNLIVTAGGTHSAVITGSSGYRSLNVVGNTLPGAVSASDFVVYTGGIHTTANNIGGSGWANLNP